MSDSLVILGEEYTNVTGIKATAVGGGTLTYIRPDGSKSITENGTGIDVAAYATVNVSVSVSPNLQTKSVTPSESAQAITADSGYDGLDEVDVAAISSTYVGSGIDRLYSSDVDFEESERIVYGSDGYYPSGFDYEVPAQSLPTSASSTSSGTTKATIGRSTSDQYINIPKGYNTALANYKVSAVPNGTVTPATSITGTGATVSHSGTTVTLSKSVSNTPNVSTAGYIGSGTAGNSNVSLSATDSNFLASNIKDSVSIFGITGTYTGEAANLQAKTNIAPTTSSQTITADSGYDGLSSVQINAMPSGTAGTPTATKGTVSNHAVSVTPSVTNTTGYITGSTKTGTAVSVSASELVSDTLTINSSGTKDVTNYASASVAAGSATAAATISGTSATVSHSGTTLTLSKTVSNTPQVSAGYVSSGTAGNSSVSLSATDANFTAANIKKDVSIFGLTGTYEGSGGGGGGMTLLKSTSLGTLTTSSTSAADTGKTMTVTGYNDYDVLVVDVSVDSAVNNRHTSTVSMVYLTGTSTVSTKNTYAVGSNKWNSRLGSTGTGSTRQSTTAYGIYVNAATVSSSTMTLTFYYRYNSSSTGTINGTYTARVYGLKLYDLIGG